MDINTLKRQIIKKKCEDNFLFFVRYFFFVMTGSKFIVSGHHSVIANKIMQCTTGEVLRLIVNMPPRYGKTELIVKMFIAWCIAKNPKAKFIHLSYSDELAFDNSSAIKEIILSKEFNELWPNIKLKDDAKSKKKWYTTEGGGVYATSSGGAVTGFGAGSTADSKDENEDIDQGLLDELLDFGLSLDWADKENNEEGLFYGAIIIDDPIKPADAESKQRRKTINGRMYNTVSSRVNSRKTPIIVVMQRLHEEDTTGYLLNPNKNEKWEHLVMPALIETGNNEYEALWPFKHTVAELLRMREDAPYVFAGQYTQSPTPPKGGMIDISKFSRYSVEPVEFDQIVISADTAFKPKVNNDPSVAMVFGQFNKKWYVLEVWRKRVLYPELKRTIKALADRYSPNAILIEDKASGQTLIPEMLEDGYPVIAIEPEGDKVTRMNVESPALESGVISLPDKAPWLIIFEDECINFPLSKHDDQVDTLSQFLKWLRKNSTMMGAYAICGEDYNEVALEMLANGEIDIDEDWDLI